MRFCRYARAGVLLLVIFHLAVPGSLTAQRIQRRDPSGMAVLAKAFAAMGGAVPVDVEGTGTVSVVEGSREENGTVRILYRGLDQTAEHMVLPSGRRALILSKGLAQEKLDDSSTKKSLEFAASSQSPNIPLVFLASAINDPDITVEYVGTETLDGVETHHLRISNSFASKANLDRLSEFTAKDIWIATATNLPKKIWFEQRAGGGAMPRIACGAVYSDYRVVAGLALPFRIERYQNGTPWADIRIEKFSVNAGLGKSEFQIQ